MRFDAAAARAVAGTWVRSAAKLVCTDIASSMVAVKRNIDMFMNRCSLVLVPSVGLDLKGVHLIARRSDIGDSIRQLRLRHRQRIEGFAQQADLTSLCHQVPSEQVMDRAPSLSGARVRHVLGERLFRRRDEDMDIVRREREVRIEFEKLLKQRADLAAASVA